MEKLGLELDFERRVKYKKNQEGGGPVKVCRDENNFVVMGV